MFFLLTYFRKLFLLISNYLYDGHFVESVP